MTLPVTPKQRKGFAVMTPEQVKRIASLGGIAAHQLGVAHTWTSEEARETGRRGGLARRGGRRKVREGAEDAR